MSEEDLRDKFALAAMQALITREEGSYPIATSYIRQIHDVMTIDDWELEKMERIALAAYKMADAMRKARLKAFG